MAERGLPPWPILQNLAQWCTPCGKSASTLLANADLIQAVDPADLHTAPWLSRTLGQETVAYATTSTSHTRPAGLAALSERPGTVSIGTATHLVAPPRLNSEEARSRIAFDAEAEQVSAELVRRGSEAGTRVHVVVELVDGPPEDALPMAAIAQAGGAFDWLADEPHLYGDADVAGPALPPRAG